MFNPFEAFPNYFRLAGAVSLAHCPVCGSGEIAQLWRLPQTRLGTNTYLNSPGSSYHDFYLDYLPTLTVPQQIFTFDMCRFCHAIFRNPKDDDQATYVNDKSKVAAFKNEGTAPFLGIVEACEQHFPKETKTVVDAACGAGQALALLRERRSGLRLVGLELSRPSVAFIQSLGIAAAVVNLDVDSLDDVVSPGSADFVLFYEAFEHVAAPVTVLQKLARMLRSGGRLYFTAQYYGPSSPLQIRVGEPIYIDHHTIDWIVGQLGMHVHDLVYDTKMRVTLQKA
jgi:SAM-dependent methyltransferase